MENLNPFLGTLLANFIVAIGIIFAVLVTRIIKKSLNNYLEYITAVTVGLLLGIIFLGFIPKLATNFSSDTTIMGVFILLGIFLFYLLELFLHWHHCKDLSHEESCHAHHNHEHKNGILMFGGTLLHNAFHGIVLFSAFAVDFHFGIATTIAVMLHSIPQNIVNYVMNDKNPKYVYIAAFGGIFGALLTYPFADFLVANKFYILAIIAGGLLYTALADIFPEFKGKGTTSKKLTYLVFIIIGIFSFLGFENISHHSHEHDDGTHQEEILHNHDDEHEEDSEHECEEHGGEWLIGYEFNECNGIGKETCEEIGGNFNSCASACRNNPESSFCTMQCVEVCEFDK